MFKPGDIVSYIGEENGKEKYRCVVITSTPSTTYCTFYAKRCSYPEGSNLGNYSFPTQKYTLVSPSLTKEEKVLVKIKTLWNNSKYVKKNPKTAY